MEVGDEFCVGRIFFRQDRNRHPFIVLSRSGDTIVFVNLSSDWGPNEPCAVEKHEMHKGSLSHTSYARFEFAAEASAAQLASVIPSGLITLSGLAVEGATQRLREGLLMSKQTKRKVRNTLQSHIDIEARFGQ